MSDLKPSVYPSASLSGVAVNPAVPALETHPLSHRQDAAIRWAAIILIVIVSTASAVLSYSGLYHLATASGIDPSIAWLFAVAVDGTLILGSAEILHSVLSGRSTKFGWMVAGTGIGLSIFGNALSASEIGAQAMIVHAIPPILMALSVETFLKIIRHRVAKTKELEALALKAQEREAKRLEREAKKTVSPVSKAPDIKPVSAPQSVSATPAPTAVSKAPAGHTAAPKRGSVSDEDPEVAMYREVIAQQDENTPATGQVAAILRAYPDARTAHIGLALGTDSKGLSTLVSRAKARIATEQGPEAAPESERDVFEELVSQMK